MNRAIIRLLLAFSFPGIAHASGLGRLFFTPEQRRQLDASAEHPTISGKKPAVELVLNGIVQRMDGTRTIWINGEAQIADGNGHAPDVQMVILPGEPQPVAITVGQRLMREQPARE